MHVKASRGQKIKSDDVFSGEFWLADEALEKGLIDGVGQLESIIEHRYGDDCKFVNVSSRKSFLGRLGKSVLPVSIRSDYSKN